jgi:hypothetical protein
LWNWIQSKRIGIFMQLPLFRRPIAIQADENIARYEATYRILEQEGTGLPGALGPYHYASHYSNTGIVLHLLVRLLPFTREFIKFQAVLRIQIRIFFGPPGSGSGSISQSYG